jgi:mRNA interferase RelE/StbE
VYRLLFHRNVEKQLAKIPKPYARRLASKIRDLREDPRPSQSTHLIKEMYRLRDGDYRVIYAVFDKEKVVFIGKIARRSEKTYKDIANLIATARRELNNKT